jgi:hypothetical protein
MRVVGLVTAALLVAMSVYMVPLFLDREFLKWHVNPWFLRICMADLPACLALTALGFRWSALLSCGALVALEGLALSLGFASEPILNMFLDGVPAAISVVAALRIALRFAAIEAASGEERSF